MTMMQLAFWFWWYMPCIRLTFYSTLNNWMQFYRLPYRTVPFNEWHLGKWMSRRQHFWIISLNCFECFVICTCICQCIHYICSSLLSFNNFYKYVCRPWLLYLCYNLRVLKSRICLSSCACCRWFLAGVIMWLYSLLLDSNIIVIIVLVTTGRGWHCKFQISFK